jgi:hypothetical protein
VEHPEEVTGTSRSLSTLRSPGNGLDVPAFLPTFRTPGNVLGVPVFPCFRALIFVLKEYRARYTLSVIDAMASDVLASKTGLNDFFFGQPYGAYNSKHRASPVVISAKLVLQKTFQLKTLLSVIPQDTQITPQSQR